MSGSPAATWSPTQSDTEPASTSEVLVVDLRDSQVGADTTLERLTELAEWCVKQFARRTAAPAPLAIVVRHVPAPSGRTSSTFFNELAICGVRGLVRQMRYDRAWRDVPLSFIDARDTADEEINDVVGALIRGNTRIDVDRSSGTTAGADWKRGDSI